LLIMLVMKCQETRKDSHQVPTQPDRRHRAKTQLPDYLILVFEDFTNAYGIVLFRVIPGPSLFL